MSSAWRGCGWLRAALATVSLISAAGCTVTPHSAGALPNGTVIREAVVRIGEFANIEAIAIAPTRAFVIGEGGMAIYDRNARRWLPPISLGVGGPRSMDYRQPCAAVTNLIGDAIWIACGGRVTVVRPAINAVWATDVGEPVTGIAVSRGGADAWAFFAGTVAVVSASGTVRPLSPGETVPVDRIQGRTVVGANQAARAVTDPLLTRDDALRVWPPSAVAHGEGAGESWVGTLGGGVFLADLDFHRSRQLPFGLRGGAVRSIARTATGVIISEDPAGPARDRSLVATASDDLTTWEWPSLRTGLGAVSSVAAHEGVLCIAGELGAGLASLSPLANSPSAQLANDHRIFEPARVAIAARDGCVVGTDRGAVLLPWSTPDAGVLLEARTLGALPPVRALAASGDTVWIGTIGGLFRSVGVDRPELVQLPPSISPNVAALALTADGLAVASPNEVWLLSGGGRVAQAARPTASVARLGRLTTLAFDDSTLWVGGTNGALAIWMPNGPALDVPLDDPTAAGPPVAGGREVRAIALAPGVAWVGTGAGIVRVRRNIGGMPK